MPGAVLVKKFGAYAAILGAFVKVAGAYQSAYTSSTAPTVISAPSITGTPTYGTPTAATAAAFAGVPTPTVTYQWNINGVPIGSPVANGSRSAAFPTLVASHIGKTLTRTDIATNSAGAISVTSAGMVVANAWVKRPTVIAIASAGSPSYFYPPRIGMRDTQRSAVIFRNPNADAVQVATVSQTNENQNAADTGYVDVAANSESVITGDSSQIWIRPRAFFDTTSITNASGTTAVATRAGHGFTTGKVLSFIGASPSGFNIGAVPITVIDANTFSYQINAAIGGSATTQATVVPYYPSLFEIENQVAQ